MAAKQRNEAEMQRIIEHLFLPPKLPSSEDADSDTSLVAIALEALVSLRDLILPSSVPAALSNAIAVIDRLQKINSLEDGKVDELALRKILLSLPLGQMLAMKVHAQNAGVVISRQADALVFEAFELSPANESVVGTKGRLNRTFPGMAVSLSTETLAQDDCAATIATTLSTMCQQKVPGMQPTSRKAGASHEEERDTASPAAVTELLFGFLRGIEPGKLTAQSQIDKHTRDEVLWNEAKIPWRRSSMWLLIRVALQLVLCRSPDGSRDLYKEFMVYIMSFVLRTTPPLSSDLMFCMSAKISRRLQKLQGVAPTLPASVRASVDHVLRETTDELSARWITIQHRDQRDLELPSLAELNFETDTQVCLPELDQYLEALRSRQRNGAPSSFVPSSQLLHHSSIHLPPLPSSNSANLYYATANLRQFEQWISDHLDQWLVFYAQDDACQQLHGLMENYHRLAESHYSQNPEMQSVMILTIYELWVACDRMAVKICPLLAEFDPDISPDVLENLLLPFRAQMHRLIGVEEYLHSRQRMATKSAEQLYSMGTQGFASRFYDQSEKHQKLLATIERDAAKAREEKAKEFQRTKAEYRRIEALHDAADCEYTTKVVDTWCDPPETEKVHSSSCRKCSLARQRDNLSIKVHEWPLPSDPARARVVVFELQIPLWLGHWRDTRAYFLQNALKGKRPLLRPRTLYLLSSNDPHLTVNHFKRGAHHRISLLSETKPCVNTHYTSKSIADLSESDVCQPNGLQYNYYDSTSTTNMGKFTYADTVAQACTYKLTRSALQSFTFRPTSAPDGPSPNSVMASQDKCPADMAIDEYKELSTISLGRHIQWANIMLQLAMPGVDFRKSDTNLLFLQCINQVGPSRGTEVVRQSHLFPSISENANSLVTNLFNAFQRVKENWESAQALHTFITIATRLLSLSSSVSSRDSCLEFLADAREVAMKWLHALREKAYAAEGQDERTSFVLKSVEVALICALTFDVEDDCLDGVLQENASILLQCSVVIQEGEHGRVNGINHDMSLLRMRHRRLLHRIYRPLAQQHLHNHLDLAVGELWSGYSPGSGGWRLVSDTADHWLTTETATTALFTSLTVHFDLLSGTLLVNGLPLDQPPRSYRQCPTYSTLFRHAAVEVMPCMAPGFDFSTKRTFGSGYAVQLGLKDGELLVRAQKDDMIFEVLPYRVMGAFPAHFQDDYVHWLDQRKGIVQFRPKSDPWNTASPAIWTLSAIPEISKWQLTKAESAVAGIHSKTSRHIASILEPLAESRAIHNIFQKSGSEQKLHVDVPTLHIGFLLSSRSSMLESREYRSMVVDDDQDVGTLVGLKSKIVLKPARTNGPHFSNRMLLVPESKSISYGRKDGHVVVTVSKTQIFKVHALTVDADLGRLIDNGDIGLYLAYLHALTSFCLVDRLTTKTGTEQALSIVSGAAINSLDRLSQDHIQSLRLLADLSPGRTFYPLNLRSMQVVRWDYRLSYLSQHGHFAQAAENLLHRARKAAVFFPETQAELQQVTLCLPDPHLLERDNIRSSTFRVSGFGAEDHTSEYDVEYKARDRDAHSPRSAHVTDMASFMFRDGDKRFLAAVSADQLWRASCEYPRVDGPSCLSNPQQVTKYSAGLISSGDEQVMKRFAALHRWLGSHDARAHKFSIMIWLSTIAAGTKLDRSILQLIGMTFKAPRLARVSPPEIDAFLPQLGFNCDSSKIRRIVTSNCKSLWSCPENSLPRMINERQQAYYDRRERAWQQKSDAKTSDFVSAISRQWPCEVPSTPGVNLQDTYIDVGNAMEAIKECFKSWHDNKLLKEYFGELEVAADSCGSQFLPTRVTARNVPEASAVHAWRAFVSEQDLFSTNTPNLPVDCHRFELPITRQQQSRQGDEPLLASLMKILQQNHTQSNFAKKYATELEESLDALSVSGDSRPSTIVSEAAIIANFRHCIEHVGQIYGCMKTAVQVASCSLPQMHGPRISPLGFLQQLSRHRWRQLSPEWQRCIVEYGVAVTTLQRAIRLLRLSDPSRRDDLVAELRNTGHTNWDPMQYPESLLIEVESDIMIREVQEQIAGYMRDPPGGENAVMQLLMGQGKSSVIVPIVSAFLAGSDGDRLCRVLVAKPQSKQMQQMLIAKLGGLVNRRVYYMPFSRSLKLDAASAATVCDLLRECTRNGGVLLVQPEHILSFQLMALECFITGREAVGRQLLAPDVQSMLKSARDIVDESDENFSVSFELIYTMGSQCAIEFPPDRWILVQQVLDAVRLLAPQLWKALPDAVEYLPGALAGSFPRVRILREEGANLLLDSLADHVCAHGLHGLQISRQPAAIRKAVRRYITTFELTADEIAAVEDSVFWTEATSSPLLLLRGFIAGGVLAFIFGQKRWRVNYGLTTAPRTPPTKLAVPYRAKDMPSPRSEFSHPDVVLFLTSLSYYYGGLDDDDLFNALSHVLNSDQADIEYMAWVQDAPTLPVAFRQLQGINLKDKSQCINEVFPCLRSGKSVIDYFLSHVVFPKEMKEFPKKLSSSGWDMGKSKKAYGGAVTGFSGTKTFWCPSILWRQFNALESVLIYLTLSNAQ